MEAGAAQARGQTLLLAHCRALEALDGARARGYERLADAIGGRLAWLLLFALTGDHGMRWR